MYLFDGGHDSRRATHQKLRLIRHELTRHPALSSVEGRPSDTLYRALRATVEPVAFNSDSPPGTLTVRWFVGEPSDPPRFTFHFATDSGFDCGWHHHEQDHVDGWGHFQEQESPESAYRYEEFSFETTEPARVVWIVLDELQDVL